MKLLLDTSQEAGEIRESFSELAERGVVEYDIVPADELAVTIGSNFYGSAFVLRQLIPALKGLVGHDSLATTG